MLKTIKRIICPVDIYDFQPEAAEYAMTMAAAFDAKIAIVYVMEPLPLLYSDESGPISRPFAEEEAAKVRAEAKLAELLTDCFNGRADKGDVLLGYAADKIVQVSEDCSADMIVMASHGRSALGRIIYGSVTNKVLANTKIPVMVIQPAKEE